MSIKRVRLVFRGQLQSALKLKSCFVTVNRIAHPTVSDFAKNLHQQFAMSSVCESIDIMVGDKYINHMQSTYYFEDNELLTICANNARVMGVIEHSSKKKQQNPREMEHNDCFPLPLVKFYINFDNAVLKSRLKEERVTVNEMQCPRIKDVALLLMDQLQIHDICKEIQLKVGSYYPSPEESTHVVRNGDTVTVCIKKELQVLSSKRKSRKRRRRDLMDGSGGDASVRSGNDGTGLQIGVPTDPSTSRPHQATSSQPTMTNLMWHMGQHQPDV